MTNERLLFIHCRPIMISTQKLSDLGFCVHDGMVKEDQQLNDSQRKYAIRYPSTPHSYSPSTPHSYSPSVSVCLYGTVEQPPKC